MKVVITGGLGFLGINIAKALLEEGNNEVILFDNLSKSGVERNLSWLQGQYNFEMVRGDIRNYNDVKNLILNHKPDIVYHLAGQVAMTTSISNPRLDFEINVLGTFNILESLRLYSKETALIYSSTNKVYGDLEQYQYEETDTRYKCLDYPEGFPENISLDFHSPYGCSKGAGDQYVLDYHRIFKLKTVVLRHSSMYGDRQLSTYDQGWVGWFCKQTLETKKKKDHTFTISGNGKQVRDLLYIDDMIQLYLKIAKNMNIVNGKAYNIGGSLGNSLSLLELFKLLEELESVTLNYKVQPVRESDQKVFVADIKKIENDIGWKPKISYREGIIKMLEYLR